MATKTRPQRPARTLVTANPALTEMREHDAMVNALPPAVVNPPKPPVQPTDIVAAVDPDGIALFLPLPVEIPTDGYVKRLGFNNIDCRLTDKGHKEAFQRMYYSLNQNDVRLSCGKHIDNPSDVIKYLLERYTLATSGS